MGFDYRVVVVGVWLLEYVYRLVVKGVWLWVEDCCCVVVRMGSMVRGGELGGAAAIPFRKGLGG